ncbi:MAG: hypothetical protein A3C79_00445 [Candidatus Taylorbacteria bacterium RIFCSPHIGHO2_02_FULL_45_28]|uniref:DUF262 domain-containing protein n=1 Tax=Candidatus Taylorbacteria bacterium RIFCSPHIGHO2_12_FULL_45_16 TaxID=1802315 RepID=A0A1G2MZ95_9BACT|nr:MAG: hypothetical protein A2830_01700 [Candidatus Taylorbacteria bacterium RIFCSPHIGHO2_01_FULL_44_110]OHA25491.1 MAG: hypothetical protein A3C79_00445 [Candidatus Taylorbacteria bacterium RIFCSPHIGHO2_02_FULL_45_28]OHA29158.1 MAG: hypothetical protein A3F51_00910 [Candidatus Taylorbacteria bacterium RIFCSPHIGHO2_12_FULL_45_16]OHA33380.1 MAG: hypothetical protein A3A23_01790 [Candidatus Taylorbacteria bacterium RIFCSPLOWO2_01_FULL_45_59]OHA44863.1 MAG: hypothetical protein A3G04_00875 [Candi
MSIKLLKAAIDIFKLPTTTKTEEIIILRGVVDPESLKEIKVDKYQREVLSSAKIKALMVALESSKVPDIELGMRGERYQVRKPDGEEVYFLQDDVFVIDGLQRITAALKLLQEKFDCKPRIGAVVHFSTSFDWERERFRILNQERTKLDVNVFLRNLQTDSEAIDMIFRLCNDSSFILQNRVKWSQNMLRGQLIPALLLCKVTGVLHSRFGPGRTSSCHELASALDTTMKTVGRTTMRDNIKTFFEVIDECFGVKRIVMVHAASYMRSTFLLSLADIFTNHTDFWRGTRLFVEQKLRCKIAKFPINDPEIERLSGAGGQARAIMYEIMLKAINSGKRKKRLKGVDGLNPAKDTSDSGDDGVTIPEAPAPTTNESSGRKTLARMGL